MLLGLLLSIIDPADLVVENAKIWTNGAIIRADFVCVTKDVITYVGEKEAGFIGPKTVRIDAKGKVLLPGFIDSHTHLMDGGIGLTQLDLRNANTKSEFLRLIKERVDNTPAGEVVIGRSWSAESWPEKTQPTRLDLDPISGDHPVMLTRMDGHSVLLNTVALKKLNITKDTKSPAGGSIDKDPVTGEPTGLLRESAMGLAGPLEPTETPAAQIEGLSAAAKMANEFGITGVSEVCSTGDFLQYTAYAKGTNPTLRIGLYPRATTWSAELDAITKFQPVQGWVYVNGIKAYMDGSLGSRTAWMHQPFTKPLPDQTSLTGLPRPGYLDGTYEKGAKEVASFGGQVILHAIGDRANTETLNMYEKVAPNLRDLRFRVEHAQHTTAADILRFGKLGVIASMQPYHKADDGRYCEEVIGSERSRTSYAFRDLLNAKAHLAFGSDWPVVEINPWLGIEAAVTGKIMTGKTWMTHQNITIDEALQSYTAEGAYAMLRDRDLGQIRPGYKADFQILNRSPFEKDVVWTSIRPETLVVAGKVVPR